MPIAKANMAASNASVLPQLPSSLRRTLMEAMHGMYRLEATMKASAPAGVMEARRACTTASWSVAPTENRTASVPAVVSLATKELSSATVNRQSNPRNEPRGSSHRPKRYSQLVSTVPPGNVLIAQTTISAAKMLTAAPCRNSTARVRTLPKIVLKLGRWYSGSSMMRPLA